jgi:hypothetical protein
MQSTCALLCVGAWILKGYVNSGDIRVAMELPEVDGSEEALGDDWDSIQ